MAKGLWKIGNELPIFHSPFYDLGILVHSPKKHGMIYRDTSP